MALGVGLKVTDACVLSKLPEQWDTDACRSTVCADDVEAVLDWLSGVWGSPAEADSEPHLPSSPTGI